MDLYVQLRSYHDRKEFEFNTTAKYKLRPVSIQNGFQK